MHTELTTVAAHSPAPRSAPRSTAAPLRWPHRPAGIAFGGDYNPEQWPEEVWKDDVALMAEAGVNLVSVGIFSWVLLEPEEGRFTFDWLDRVLDLLHGADIAVDLATPTAAPPAWLALRYPEIRPVTREGHVLGGGARAGFCPNSPAYADAAARITGQLADRYGDHPSLVMWHVHNEYGGHVPACYCEQSAAAFRHWLQARYANLGELNRAWGTSFWGQRYGDWAEIDVPRLAPTAVNPTQRLDFMRFSSDALLDCYRTERDILHRASPGIPVTTNFMATNCKNIDYWAWAAEVDVVSNDHYLRAEDPDNHIDLAMAADLTRSLAGGAPWLLMEHSTSAVNWQPRNIAKRPGEMRRNSLTHVGRGADSVLFFQWRAASRGGEKFHSAMLPHAGTDTRVWREVAALGNDLPALAELRGTRVQAQAALVWDWQSWWALELEWRPSVDLTFQDQMASYYERLWRAQLTTDFVHPEADLTRYPLVVVPSLYLTTAAAARNLTDYVERGGTLVVSYFSGVVDEDDAVQAGGPPGALRDVLGLSVEEFLPLRAQEQVSLSDGGTGDIWVEELRPQSAETMTSYVDGPAAGGPAVTRNRFGAGNAWYISTRVDDDGLDALLRRICADAGLEATTGAPDGVEIVRRVGDGQSYLIAINHHPGPATVTANGVELLTGTPCGPTLVVPGGSVRVVRETTP